MRCHTAIPVADLVMVSGAKEYLLHVLQFACDRQLHVKAFLALRNQRDKGCIQELQSALL